MLGSLLVSRNLHHQKLDFGDDLVFSPSLKGFLPYCKYRYLILGGLYLSYDPNMREVYIGVLLKSD